MSNMVNGIRDPLDRLWTHRDLDDTPDDGNKYEVIDGVPYMTPLPTAWHERAGLQLAYVLIQHVEAHGLGEVFHAGLKVVLDDLTGVGPDVVFIPRDRAPGLRRDGLYGPPALVAEVLSSKPRLDRVVKRDRYARAGIPWYWIVDPDMCRLWEYELRAGEYVTVSEQGGDAEFRPGLFPGLVIALSRLWGQRPPE